MNWIIIGTLLGSIVTSQHATREDCEGRKVLLTEKGAVVKCVEAPNQSFTITPNYPGQGIMQFDGGASSN